MNGITLIYSRDIGLSQTRVLMLSRIGRRAEIAVDFPAAKSICEKGRVELAILCHTLSDFEQMAITDMIRSRSEGTQVLTLCIGKEYDDAPPSRHLFHVEDGPSAFLQKCETLIRQQKGHSKKYTLPAC